MISSCYKLAVYCVIIYKKIYAIIIEVMWKPHELLLLLPQVLIILLFGPLILLKYLLLLIIIKLLLLFIWLSIKLLAKKRVAINIWLLSIKILFKLIRHSTFYLIIQRITWVQWLLLLNRIAHHVIILKLIITETKKWIWILWIECLLLIFFLLILVHSRSRSIKLRLVCLTFVQFLFTDKHLISFGWYFIIVSFSFLALWCTCCDMIRRYFNIRINLNIIGIISIILDCLYFYLIIIAIIIIK